jgi:hypothetical protein
MNLMNVGIGEILLVIGVLALIFGGKYFFTLASASIRRVTTGAGEASVWLGDPPDPTRAYPDPRYAHGVRTGEIAELFGIGPRGVRFAQVATLLIAITIGNQPEIFQWIQMGVVGVSDQWRFMIRPAFFIFAAITAIRSFDGVGAIALVTGGIYALLVLALNVIQGRVDHIDELVIRQNAASAIGPALAMVALQLGVIGTARWVRIAVGLALTGVLQSLSDSWLVDTWNVVGAETPLVILVRDSPRIIVRAFVWTAGFFAARKFFGGDRAL